MNEYMIWFMQDSAPFINSVHFNSNATTIDVIYSKTLREVPVPIPPKKEQINKPKQQKNEAPQVARRISKYDLRNGNPNA